MGTRRCDLASISVSQVLDLVGKLDDSPGSETPRERFRRFLRDNTQQVGQVRDYIEECLRKTGDPYCRALQDLVNRLGELLGFKVTYGRYQGVTNEIGFDGHWESPTGFHVVVEVKTTDVYAIKTATLVGYADRLISEKCIPNWDKAMGLYVVGRPDREMKQLENAIVAERRTYQLRTITVESLLSLAEMMADYGVGHQDILAVMMPSRPAIDDIVDLMRSLVVGAKTEPAEPLPVSVPVVGKDASEPYSAAAQVSYWLSPVKPTKGESSEEIIAKLVGQHGIYAFGERTPGRTQIAIGDWICFYANGNGVVAHARVSSLPEERRDPRIEDPDKYRWVFSLDNAKLYAQEPVAVDAAVRRELEAFQGKDPNKSWAWFVQGTKRISETDFRRLTRC